jgi:hypothetical protein
MATRSEAHQSLTSNRISFTDTYMRRQQHPSGLQGNTVQTQSLIRQEVEKICNRSNSGQHHPNAVIIRVIKCSKSATIQTLGQHRLNVALIWKHVERVMESRLHSCLSRRPQLVFERRLEKTESMLI